MGPPLINSHLDAFKRVHLEEFKITLDEFPICIFNVVKAFSEYYILVL